MSGRGNLAVGLQAGLAIMVLLALLAVFGPSLYGVGAWTSTSSPFLPPLSADAWLGTDLLGRDVMAGIIEGARVSLFVGAVATLGAVVIGGIVGLVAGYFRGAADTLLMAVTEFFQTIPSFILAVLLVSIFNPSLQSIVIAIALVSWPQVARVVRTQTLSLREREFVMAARLSGKPVWKVIVVDIVPHVLSSVLIVASVIVANAILTESALSFLGLGDPNVMSWGYMVGAGRTVIRQAWWVSVFPGAAVLLTVVAINLVGEALNDALNPRIARA